MRAHRESFDHEAIALDRAEAGDRALFDPSREASLARRYESEARRGFFKTLKEFRQAEAEMATHTEAEAEAETPPPVVPLASSRDRASTPPRDPEPAPQGPPDRRDRHSRGIAHVPLAIGRPLQSTS